MTQPPQQPPNEPPQQPGFGAPQAPQPGGYGTPQPPQQPPAAPQQPPTAPQQPPTAPQQGPPPGFAKPPAAPPGGQPPPPPGTPPTPGQPGQGGQAQGGYQAGSAHEPTMIAGAGGGPGYGYPAQQQYGGPQQPTVIAGAAPPAGGGGGGFFNRTQWIIVVSAVVVMALIIGGGFWYSSSKDGKNDQASSDGKDKGGDGGKGEAKGGGTEKVPANTSARVLFQLPAPEVPKDDVYSVQGSWLTDKVYAKAGVAQLVGHSPDTGAKTWTTPLDGQTCAASPEVSKDGVAAVVYEEQKRVKKGDVFPCDKVSAFDTNTGKLLWTKTVKVGDSAARFEEVSISGSTVALGGGTDGGAAYDLETGKELWAPDPSATCKDDGYRGGEQLVAVRSCGSYDNPSVEVQLLDPVTGKPKWTYKVPAGIDNAKVISTKPVVFGVDSGEITSSGVTDVFALDDASGKLRSKISLDDGKYDHDCGVNKVHDCHGIIVGNDKLYVPTAEHEGTNSDDIAQTNEIVSFSLATGKSTADHFLAGDRWTMFPLRMDGDNVIAYKDGPYDKGAQVDSIDPSGKATLLLETPASQPVLDALSSMVPKTSEMLYSQGHLFLGKDLVSAPYSPDEKEYTALGFGTSS